MNYIMLFQQITILGFFLLVLSSASQISRYRYRQNPVHYCSTTLDDILIEVKLESFCPDEPCRRLTQYINGEKVYSLDLDVKTARSGICEEPCETEVSCSVSDFGDELVTKFCRRSGSGMTIELLFLDLRLHCQAYVPPPKKYIYGRYH